MKVIPTIVHGVVDYLMVVVLFSLPFLLPFSNGVAYFFWVMAGALLIYSLVTRYEMGAFKVLPMRTHLLLDYASGAAFLIAALLFAYEAAWVRWLMAGIGVLEIAAAALTITEPYAVGSGAGVGTTPPRRDRQPGL